MTICVVDIAMPVRRRKPDTDSIGSPHTDYSICDSEKESRVARLRENLQRCGLTAEVVAADAADWNGGPFDAVLVDAPCSSTGTIRRHPDIPWLKKPAAPSFSLPS